MWRLLEKSWTRSWRRVRVAEVEIRRCGGNKSRHSIFENIKEIRFNCSVSGMKITPSRGVQEASQGVKWGPECRLGVVGWRYIRVYLFTGICKCSKIDGSSLWDSDTDDVCMRFLIKDKLFKLLFLMRCAFSKSRGMKASQREVAIV